MNMQLLWGVPYMPWYNGIEFFWKTAKHMYRKRVQQLRVRDQDFNNEAEVRNII
jgi:transposase